MVNAKLLKDLDEVLETKNRTIIMGVVNLSLDSFSKDIKRRILFLIVAKFVNVPPSHLSTT